jgi:hypothetical protein
LPLSRFGLRLVPVTFREHFSYLLLHPVADQEFGSVITRTDDIETGPPFTPLQRSHPHSVRSVIGNGRAEVMPDDDASALRSFFHAHGWSPSLCVPPKSNALLGISVFLGPNFLDAIRPACTALYIVFLLMRSQRQASGIVRNGGRSRHLVLGPIS